MPREEFTREVEKQLTGRDSVPSELIYFKVYKSQAPVIEQAIDTRLSCSDPTRRGGTVWR